MENLTSKKAWHAWRRYCAVDLCPPLLAAELKEFGASRFCLYIKRYASRVGHDSSELLRLADWRNGWHLLETHARVGTMRSGKRYKDWLLRRGGPKEDWIDRVEAGASVLMRSAVREYLRRELSSHLQQSFDRLVGGDIALSDLLPDRADTRESVLMGELEVIAEEVAQSFLPTMSYSAKQVMLVASLDAPLNHPEVVSWIGLTRSTVYALYTRTISELGQSIQRDFHAEPPEVRLKIAQISSEKIKSSIFLQLSSEKSTARVFKKVKPERFQEAEIGS